jgi:hypothetical protein
MFSENIMATPEMGDFTDTKTLIDFFMHFMFNHNAKIMKMN